MAKFNPNYVPVAGKDCYGRHTEPPWTICDGPLCEAWLEVNSTPKQCEDAHQHSEHWWSLWEGYHKCEGREFCADLGRALEVVKAAEAWRDQFTSSGPWPRQAALIAAVDRWRAQPQEQP